MALRGWCAACTPVTAEGVKQVSDPTGVSQTRILMFLPLSTGWDQDHLQLAGDGRSQQDPDDREIMKLPASAARLPPQRGIAHRSMNSWRCSGASASVWVFTWAALALAT